MNISELIEAKNRKQKIAVLSCYDYITARLASACGINVLLVGDSAAQAVLGHNSTLPAKMDFMVEITAGVRKGAPNACIIADMPFLSYQTGIKDALLNAGRFITEAGAQIVKIEVNESYLDVVKSFSNAGIAVMAHLGIRPQNILKLGKFRASGTTAEESLELINLAEKMVSAGASSLLLEGTAEETASIITEKVDVPVISCGSGVGCDGQVLIAPDVLGLSEGVSPRFTKSYGNIGNNIKDALQAYLKEVKEGIFPDKDHSYHMKDGEFEKLRQILDRQQS